MMVSRVPLLSFSSTACTLEVEWDVNLHTKNMPSCQNARCCPDSGKCFTRQMKLVLSARGSPAACHRAHLQTFYKNTQLGAFLWALLLFCLSRPFCEFGSGLKSFILSHDDDRGDYSTDKITADNQRHKEACQLPPAPACCPHITRKKAVWLKCWSPCC